MLVALEAVFEFPAASVNVAPATEMDPEPEFVFVVGVNTTEYTVDDVVVRGPMVPPDTVTSPTAKSVDASDSVNVMVSVWPDLSVPDPVRASETVGEVVSIVTVKPEEVEVTVESSRIVVD